MTTEKEMALNLATALAFINVTADALTKPRSKREREAMQFNLRVAAAKIAQVRDELRTR